MPEYGHIYKVSPQKFLPESQKLEMYWKSSSPSSMITIIITKSLTIIITISGQIFCGKWVRQSNSKIEAIEW